MKDYEADRFFVAYKENLRDSPKREALINSLLENLVSSQDYFEETYKPTQTGAYNQSSVGKTSFLLKMYLFIKELLISKQ